MSVNLSKVVGFELPDKPVSWNKRDLLTYAVGVGAKNDEFQFAYASISPQCRLEVLAAAQDPNFAAIPTYPVVLQLKGNGQDVNLFAERIKGRPIPGMPPLDPNRVVHGTQSIEIIKDIPLVSGPGWTWKTKYVGISENKSGIVLTAENKLVSPDGQVYAKLYSSSFNLGAKATGQKYTNTIASPPTAKPIPKSRATTPDYKVPDETSLTQALAFRLSGDYNPLHIDPRIGKAAGFGGVILHGLSTFGFAARAVINAVGGGDPRSLRLFGVRFTAPVKPGDKLETDIWEVGAGPEGTMEVTFVTRNLTSGKVALGGGIAYVRKPAQAKL
ncbi:peroxisomal dehydratase [Macrolepiota fuliginosa MF-IS2]|uniref:Peroxisomal dehydratase n=1 Tax=Macrolepiota fuliginosa MF-IS2 TaxID=1400762 RepID=A0A9P6C8V7_9AGAR|nr:peroxisomal dehydratase [Macrolepiota fuliginosa MF-IS2]